jgi:hypothetical protein
VPEKPQVSLREATKRDNEHVDSSSSPTTISQSLIARFPEIVANAPSLLLLLLKRTFKNANRHDFRGADPEKACRENARRR